ncbi:MAG: DUF1565 domain-containing protein [Planctomycetes bacterium]|nr:DUF1565 domain-containing protein [Planctomycetota bacterium]
MSLLSLPRSFAFVALLCIGSARADDFYVDLDAGSDAAVGTSAAPWRTLTHAMATVAPSSGHRVLVRGTATLSSPGESFPIRVPAGVSLEAWDAQQGAVLDAELQPCLEIVGPEHRGQSLRGYAGNLRLIGEPAISVDVLGIAESVDLVVDGCAVWGELRMILAEAVGQTRFGSCALTVRSCDLIDVTVDCRTSSISTTQDVLSVSLSDNSYCRYLLLRGLSAPTRPLELLRNREVDSALLERCSAATAVIEDNVFDRTIHADVSASTVLCRRNYSEFGMYFAAQGRLEVLANRVFAGSLSVCGAGTQKIHDNVSANGAILFDSLGPLSAPCSVLRNHAAQMEVEVLGSQALTIADNFVTEFGMNVRSLPSASVEIVRNQITQAYSEGGMNLRLAPVGTFPEAPQVTIADNQITGYFREGAGVLVDAILGKLVIERNDIRGFGSGLHIADASVVHGSPNGWNFRIERNAIYGSRIGVELGLGGSQEDLRFLNNEIASLEEGLLLRRGTYLGTIRCWNNILSSEGNQAVSGGFAPIDLVWSNLCSDTSLLALHPTNISGDPQFDPASGRLRSSSPAVGSGIDPLTALPGFNMGRDPLQPAATLQFRAQSEAAATLRLDAPGSSVALLLFGAAASNPADIALCDGLLGIDLGSWLFSVPQPVSNGTLVLPLALPPGTWTVVVQALYDAASAVPPCRASNMVVVRR